MVKVDRVGRQLALPISFCYDEELLRKIQLICAELDLICPTQEDMHKN